jgi:hypothetical protein
MNLGHQEKLRQILRDGDLDFRRRLPGRLQFGLEDAANFGGVGGGEGGLVFDG